jgi:hypothetical protein
MTTDLIAALAWAVKSIEEFGGMDSEPPLELQLVDILWKGKVR